VLENLICRDLWSVWRRWSFFVFAAAQGLTFVDSRIGVLSFLVAYVLYCATAFRIARSTIGLQSVLGWALSVPTVGGSLLRTVGDLGLALIMGAHEPQGGGALGPHHRYVITTYGNATTSEDGSNRERLQDGEVAPFLEQRIFEARFDCREVEMGTISAELDLRRRASSGGAV